MESSQFFKYYQSLFGARWSALAKALQGECIYHKLQFAENREPYFLDEASYFAAKQLGVLPGMEVLDMCAAPGGKTLVLASALAGAGSLQSNDRSLARRQRLIRVLDDSLPEAWRKIVSVSGHDASRFGLHRKECYDRILLDAPCSSERHVMASPAHLAAWSEKRIKRLAQEQGALLAAAADAARPGGQIVYSTCALSPAENDDVIRKILKKRAGIIRVVSLTPEIEGTETTEFGLHLLPDTCGGRGPIFCAKLEKS